MLSSFSPERYYSIFTPAKVNFRLQLLNKRPDGYHELKMDMLPITLADQLVIIPATSEKWQTKRCAAYGSVQNLLLKLSRSLNIKFKLDFRLVKLIPHKAGLGGSSGNIGGFSYLLAYLLKDELLAAKLYQTAISCGKDVAFFLNPRASLATGLGDKLSQLDDFPELPLILLKPKFDIATKAAYSNCVINPTAEWPTLNKSTIERLEPTINGFWNNCLPFFDKLMGIRKELLKTGAVKNVFLTGSGSCLVLIFDNFSQQNLFFDHHGSKFDDAVFYRTKTVKTYKYKILAYP